MKKTNKEKKAFSFDDDFFKKNKYNKKKTISSKKNKNKKIFTFNINFYYFLIFILIFFILIICFFFVIGVSQEKKFEKSNIINNKNNFELITDKEDNFSVKLIYDSTCSLCNEEAFINNFKKNLGVNLSIEKINSSSVLGKEIITDRNFSFLPIFLFSENFVSSSHWTRLSSSFEKIFLKNKTYYKLNSNIIPIKKSLLDFYLDDDVIIFGNSNKNRLIIFIDYSIKSSTLLFGNKKIVDDFNLDSSNFKYHVPNLFSNFVDLDLLELVFIHVDTSQNSSDLFNLGSICSFKQDKWSQYNDFLIRKENILFSSLNIEKDFYSELEKEDFLDFFVFETCMKSSLTREQLLREQNLAKNLLIDITPTFLINDLHISGIIRYENLENIIYGELVD